jgi:RND family efflux transporter MFP subunit
MLKARAAPSAARGWPARTARPVPITWAPIAAVLATLLILVGCDQGGDSEAAPRASTRPDHLVSVTTLEPAPSLTETERTASLRHRREVRVHTQEEGRIVALPLYEADRVDTGALVARLDDSLLQAERDKAVANRDQRRIDLDRLADLQRKRAASEDEVAQAQTALAVAEAELRLLDTRLGFTRISAPFDAIVTERLAEPGDFVTKNTHLLTLADPDSLVAETRVSELLLPELAVGDAASVRIDALPGETFAGRILRIHPRVEESSRQGIVEIVLEPIPEGARAGLFARVTFRIAMDARLVVPYRSLQRDREGEFLWVVGPDSAAHRRRVTSGLRIADGIEILAGAGPGDRVITRGFLGLSDGKPVRVVEG